MSTISDMFDNKQHLQYVFVAYDITWLLQCGINETG